MGPRFSHTLTSSLDGMLGEVSLRMSYRWRAYLQVNLQSERKPTVVTSHPHLMMTCSVLMPSKTTSADMKKNVLKPPKNPTKTDISSMKPDRANIAASNAISLKWLQKGVLGENDS